MQRRGPWPVEDAEVEVERMVLPRSSATRGFGLAVLLPPGPRSRAARRDEDAGDSAAGRALRAVSAAPTKSSSPAAPRLRCVGAEGRFWAPLSGPPASWRLFSGLGRKGVRRGAGAAAPAAAPSRAAATAAAPTARAPAPARRSSPCAAHSRAPPSVVDRAPRSASAARPGRAAAALAARAAWLRGPLPSPISPAAAALVSRPRLPPPPSFPARVAANRRPPSCGCSRPDPRQPPAPAPPKRPSEFHSCYPGWSAMALTTTSASWVQAILLPQPPE
uniref:sterile alpha motif domain-containing protein 1-like n=1 Tax=Callithrix jacchus TaxID=9483 RepID=UPI0023DD53CD|nr:sterile alpha motif domain-containing protein 1-like [Callithrix jacchus]XP_054100059.1 sterile alpha motif domain-containing protein 1-like [Callithrix jacchus]